MKVIAKGKIIKSSAQIIGQGVAIVCVFDVKITNYKSGKAVVKCILSVYKGESIYSRGSI